MCSLPCEQALHQSAQENLPQASAFKCCSFHYKSVAFARATFRVLLAINLSFLSAATFNCFLFTSRVKLLKRTKFLQVPFNKSSQIYILFFRKGVNNQHYLEELQKKIRRREIDVQTIFSFVLGKKMILTNLFLFVCLFVCSPFQTAKELSRTVS